MRPEIPGFLRVLPIGLGLVLGLPTVANAGKLEVTVESRNDVAVVRIRGLEDDVKEPRIAASANGLLMFFEGDEVEAQRIYADNPRLRYVQTGQSTKRAAVRLVQREQSAGSLQDYLRQIRVPGGMDLLVGARRRPSPPLAGDVQGPVEPAAAEAPSAADLDRRLADEAKVPADPPELELVLDELEKPVPGAPGPEHHADPEVAAAVVEPAKAEPGEEAVPEAASADPAGEQAAPAADETPAWPERTEGGASVASWRTFTLIPALGLLVGFALWVRRRKGPAKDARRIEVLERASVGPRQQLVWVRVADRELLLGITDQNVAMLADVGGSIVIAPGRNATMQMHAVGEGQGRTGGDDRVAAFKRRLESALRDEISGVHPLPKPPTKPQPLREGSEDPAWTKAFGEVA